MVLEHILKPISVLLPDIRRVQAVTLECLIGGSKDRVLFVRVKGGEEGLPFFCRFDPLNSCGINRVQPGQPSRTWLEQGRVSTGQDSPEPRVIRLSSNSLAFNRVKYCGSSTWGKPRTGCQARKQATMARMMGRFHMFRPASYGVDSQA
jgi:hypothetical protein